MSNSPDPNNLGHLIQQIAFSLSADSSGRVIGELEADGPIRVRILDQAAEAQTGCSATDLVAALADTERSVVLDLSGCSYLSSTDLAFVARLASVRRELGARITVEGACNQARKMFGLVGLDDAFDL